MANSGSRLGSTPNSSALPPPPPPAAPPISSSPPPPSRLRIALCCTRSERRCGPGSTATKCELSDDDVASTRAESLVSLVSGAAAAAGAADEEEEEGREGIERSTSGVPNEMMSRATLFFLSFLPSCQAGEGPEVSSRAGTREGTAPHLDERGLAVLDGAASKDNDALTLVLVLAVLERKLQLKAHARQGVSAGWRTGGGRCQFTHLCDLNARHEVCLAARLDVVERGHELALVLRERDEHLGSGGGGRRSECVSSQLMLRGRIDRAVSP